MILLDAPSATDWMQAVAAVIGIPGAMAAFFLLFTRDREKEKAIQALSDLVTKQDAVIDQMNAQLLEFTQQTHELQRQTYLSSIGNSLLSDQVKVLSEHFDFTKEITTSRIDQQNRDRKKSLLPRFQNNGSHFDRFGNRINITLLNDGNVASHIRIDQNSDTITVRHHTDDVVYGDQAKNNEHLNLIVDYLASKGAVFDSNFFIRFNFQDADGNTYLQTLLYQNGQFRVGEPVEKS